MEPEKKSFILHMDKVEHVINPLSDKYNKDISIDYSILELDCDNGKMTPGSKAVLTNYLKSISKQILEAAINDEEVDETALKAIAFEHLGVYTFDKDLSNSAKKAMLDQMGVGHYSLYVIKKHLQELSPLV